MTFPPDDQLPIFVFGVKAEVPPSAEESSDFDLGAKQEKKKKKDKEVVAEVEAEAEADFDFGAAKKKKKKDKEVVAEEPPAEASAEAADFDFGAPPLTHIASPSGTACAKGAGAQVERHGCMYSRIRRPEHGALAGVCGTDLRGDRRCAVL